jgi:hypothetical protein
MCLLALATSGSASEEIGSFLFFVASPKVEKTSKWSVDVAKKCCQYERAFSFVAKTSYYIIYNHFA